MTENKLDSANSVPADIEFELSNYKPKILGAIIKFEVPKKSPDLDFIFHDILRK